jgi:hypothetical protein
MRTSPGGIRTLSNNQFVNELTNSFGVESAAPCSLRLQTRFRSDATRDV